ncbi:MAG: pyridoxal 5'-phosphate synthase glutaminase subunit PdxT [Candidatus Eisenbacteria bacterium]|nr:pyridoxal 5'-phosphate synthase glutaminase subunit PdxT [Candidatus Eisenbacteria bacterium]
MTTNGKPRIGLLALQGAFAAHGEVLRGLGAETVDVRLPEKLNGLDGLVLPGGESTTLIRLFDEYRFAEPLRAFARSGRPILATCMGLILLAREVHSPAQASLGLMDIAVERNAYGRQVDSFEAMGKVGDDPFRMIFIRAPRIHKIGPDVEVLGRLQSEPVLVRQGKILGATFHPELAGDPAVHRIFLELFQ